jgi:hypothetical protein
MTKTHTIEKELRWKPWTALEETALCAPWISSALA